MSLKAQIEQDITATTTKIKVTTASFEALAEHILDFPQLQEAAESVVHSLPTEFGNIKVEIDDTIEKAWQTI